MGKRKIAASATEGAELSPLERKYRRYAEVSNMMAVLEAERDEIKVQLADDVSRKPEGKFELEGVGSFSLRMIKSWKYPPSVTQKEIEFKDAKKKAEESGDASFEEKKSLVFKSK